MRAELEELQALVQKAGTDVFEDGVTELFSSLIGTTFAIAKSGSQHGTDASTAGRQDRSLLIECKRYRDSTPLDERSLRGEIDEAQERTPGLEAWILASSRSVPDQVETGLYNSGLRDGVPVLVVDWKTTSTPALPALLAWDPSTTEKHFGARAGALATLLAPSFIAKIAELQRELEAWQIGFGALRARSLELLRKVRTDRHESALTFNQAVKGPQFVRRTGASRKMAAWLASPSAKGSPLCVIGSEGVGKTWATIDWLEQVEDQLPITLVVPSSAMPGLTKINKTGLTQFLGERLHELTRVRDAAHWRGRVDQLLLRPPSEGAAFVVVFDGVNQEPLFDWTTLLKVLQAEPFRERVRVVLSTRQTYFDNELRQLKALVDKPDQAEVDKFNDAELDAMLQQHGLSRASMRLDLLEQARTPRLFSLVVRLHDRLKDVGQITVQRLLFEHGRDTLGDRAWSDAQWRDWLRGVADRAVKGITRYSRQELAEQARDFSQSPSHVSRRLSEIIDGTFTRRDAADSYQLDPVLVNHALGAALVERAAAETDVAKADNALAGWLEPVAGLDQRAEVLRAAVSIALESGQTGPMLTLLVSAWLQTQNLASTHRSELIALAPGMPDNLLDVVERTGRSAQSSARLVTLTALRSLDRGDASIRDRFVARATKWLSVTARFMIGSEDAEKSRRQERLREQIGAVSANAKTVLGVPLQIVDYDTDQLGASAAALLEGFSLQQATAAFTAGALSALLSPLHPHWESLKWLCLLNEVDPEPTALSLRQASAQILARTPEPGVHPRLQQRVAAFLLYLTGYAADQDAGRSVDSEPDLKWSYERDYLDNIGRGFFAVERRHAAQVLADIAMTPIQRAHALQEHWLDPMFVPTAAYCDELRTLVKQFPVDKLYINRYATSESHEFERLLPVLARCLPDELAQLWRSWAAAGLCKAPDAQLWHALELNNASLVQGDAERAAARALRETTNGASEQMRYDIGNRAILVEIAELAPVDQVKAVLAAALPDLMPTLRDGFGALSQQDVDELVAQSESQGALVQEQLLEMLSGPPLPLSDTAWSWIATALESDNMNLVRQAYMILGTSDAARLGAELLQHGWRWQAAMDPGVAFHCSNALVVATRSEPFDQVWPRLPPWWWLEAARIRGEDPAEVLEAATAFDAVIRADTAPEFDSGAQLTVWKGHSDLRPLGVSVQPLPEAEADSSEGFFRMLNDDMHDATFKAARKIAWERITLARQTTSSLVMMDMTAAEFEMVWRVAPQFIERWIEGYDTLTDAFRRRVRLAEVPFLALCEVLLASRPDLGAALWNSLRQTLHSRVVGGANLPELLHLVFRAPDSPPVEALRRQLLGLDASTSDHVLYELVLAAQYNRRRNWVEAVIVQDAVSMLNWRQQRAIVLSGFLAFNELPVADAWPDGPLHGSIAQLEHQAARERWREACARHWWREYWARDTAEGSYAAWVLFRASADRRAELWEASEMSGADASSPLHTRKRWHARLNRGPFNAGLDKASAGKQRKFLGRSIEPGIAPWRQQSSATQLPT
ncbi:hypothetical protein NJF45_20335 [Stenotrophomonas maltophilia]|uniref:hypothetical protein n=1 Tax=Stenotrophomonas maltophilia TaxID=40324 RepID=UPI0020984A50|nr:hypothetical protein [Stenotrophomonas maltophilia]MCO7464252.1 hypothetical protein [Stenotrophomonas maltophilia]